MVYTFFDKKSQGSGRPSTSASLIANNETKQNIQLADEFHKSIIRNFEEKKSIFFILR